jgi:hypothetical protein
VDQDRNGNQDTDWNAWAMPARRTTTDAPSPAPPPPPLRSGSSGHWGAPPPPPPYPGHWGGPAPYGPSPYQAGYGSPYGGWSPSPTVNGMAIASMVCGIIWIYWIGSVLALVFGYIAKSQIDKSHGTQSGRGMAIAGIVLGWVGIGFLVLIFVLGFISGLTEDPGSNSF